MQFDAAQAFDFITPANDNYAPPTEVDGALCWAGGGLRPNRGAYPWATVSLLSTLLRSALSLLAEQRRLPGKHPVGNPGGDGDDPHADASAEDDGGGEGEAVGHELAGGLVIP